MNIIPDIFNAYIMNVEIGSYNMHAVYKFLIKLVAFDWKKETKILLQTWLMFVTPNRCLLLQEGMNS